jgi:hypothetical protein
MNIPVRISDPFEHIDALDDAVERHPYSARCNCDACFNAWMAMPPPSPEEQERQARAFSLAVAPSGGGELVTDWPRPHFPDLDTADDAVGRLIADLAKGARQFRRSGL